MFPLMSSFSSAKHRGGVLPRTDNWTDDIAEWLLESLLACSKARLKSRQGVSWSFKWNPEQQSPLRQRKCSCGHWKEMTPAWTQWWKLHWFLLPRALKSFSLTTKLSVQPHGSLKKQQCRYTLGWDKPAWQETDKWASFTSNYQEKPELTTQVAWKLHCVGPMCQWTPLSPNISQRHKCLSKRNCCWGSSTLHEGKAVFRSWWKRRFLARSFELCLCSLVNTDTNTCTKHALAYLQCAHLPPKTSFVDKAGKHNFVLEWIFIKKIIVQFSSLVHDLCHESCRTPLTLNSLSR